MRRVAKRSENVSALLILAAVALAGETGLPVAADAHLKVAEPDRNAEAAYQSALALRETEAGPDAVALLPLLNHLALLSRDAADYGRARQFAERARTIAELHNAADTADGAAAFANLGDIEQMQGNMAAARKWLERALSIRQRLLGPSHPLIAETLNDLALLDRVEGRLKAAGEGYRRALTVLQAASQADAGGDSKTLLAIDRKSAVVRNNLGQVEAEQGHLKEAEEITRRSVMELERAFGREHSETAAGYVNLAKVLRYRRRFDEAKQTLLRAEAIDRQNLAPDHTRIAQDLSLEGALAFDRKKYTEAESLFQQSLAILTRRFAAPQRDIGRTTANLAEVYLREKRFPEAADAFGRALAILEQALGCESPELLSTMEHYAQVLRMRQDFAQAASLEARVMKIRVTRTLKGAA